MVWWISVPSGPGAVSGIVMQPKDKFLESLMLRQAGGLSLSLRRTSRTPEIFWYISSKKTNADINLFPLISKHRRNNLSGKIVSKLKMCPRVVFLSWFVVPRSCEHVKLRLAEHEVAIHPAIGSMYLVSIISKLSIYRYLPLHQITRSKSGPESRLQQQKHLRETFCRLVFGSDPNPQWRFSSSSHYFFIPLNVISLLTLTIMSRNRSVLFLLRFETKNNLLIS